MASGRTVCGFCHATITSQTIQAKSRTKASNPEIVPFDENPSAPTTTPWWWGQTGERHDETNWPGNAHGHHDLRCDWDRVMPSMVR